MRLCVVGLGRLGAPLAAVLARAGHRVIGVDASPQTVSRVERGLAPVDETGLQELVDAVGARLGATTDLRRAVRSSRMTFVVVPTPSGPDGGFVLDHVLEAVREVGAALAGDQPADHVVVITSTVMPGSTGGAIRAELEAAAGRPLGAGLGLCYSPEFIALGSVIHDLTHPDMLLVGASDAAAAERLAGVLDSITAGAPPLARLSLIDAEVAKLAVNSFVTTRISFANTLGEICERLPGADAAQVARAVGLDGRIGPRYLRPATAYGGPCFPRDNRAVSALARRLGVPADLAEATDRVNRRQTGRLVERVLAGAGESPTVAVLGLAYKPATAVVEASAGVALAAALRDRGVAVIVHDPTGRGAASAALGDGVAHAGSVEAAVAAADVVVVTTPWPEYAAVPALAGGRTVIDCWGCCDPSAGGPDVESGRPAASRPPQRPAA